MLKFNTAKIVRNNFIAMGADSRLISHSFVFVNLSHHHMLNTQRVILKFEYVINEILYSRSRGFKEERTRK